MDERQTAMLWQLMQSLNSQLPGHDVHTNDAPLENTLLAIRPFLQPKQQMIIDLMAKLQEVKQLMDEIQAM